jgi:hypothetical protein
MRWNEQITSREIRLLSALAILVVFALGTTTPSGVVNCCGATEPDYKVTFINNYADSPAAIWQPTIEYSIWDTSSSGGPVVVMQLVDGDFKTHALPGGKIYNYVVHELLYGGFPNPYTSVGKCIDAGFIIADAEITIK